MRKTIFLIALIGITAPAGPANACPKNVAGIFGCRGEILNFLPPLYDSGIQKKEFSVTNVLAGILEREAISRGERRIMPGELGAIVNLLRRKANQFETALPELLVAMDGNEDKEEFARGMAQAFHSMTSALDTFNNGNDSGLRSLYFHKTNSSGIHGHYQPRKKMISMILPENNWELFLENPESRPEFSPFIRTLVHELGHYVSHQRVSETPISPIQFQGVQMAYIMLTEVISYAEGRAWGRNGPALLSNMESLVQAATLADFIHKDALQIRLRHPRYRFERNKKAQEFYGKSNLTPAEILAQMAPWAVTGARYFHFPR